jgi:hypothetical protein
MYDHCPWRFYRPGRCEPLSEQSQWPQYACLGALGGREARVVFEGTLDGVPQRWQARLRTLRHCYLEFSSGSGEPAALRQYIEVGESGAEGRRLEVGLMVPAIDGATVAKAIIMIRQYRNLRPGRHEFGPRYLFPAETEAQS